MKKLIALALVLVMALSLVACGAPAKKDEAGELLIGCLQDVTGSTSSLGKSVQAGAQAAIDKINAAGGIGGDGLQVPGRGGLQTDAEDPGNAGQRPAEQGRSERRDGSRQPDQERKAGQGNGEA